MSLTQYLTKPIARLALATTLVLSPFFYDSRQEARAQDLGGLVDKIEKTEKVKEAEKKPVIGYGDLKDYLFREDELPEGYRVNYSNKKMMDAMISQEYPDEKRGITEVVLAEYEKDDKDKSPLPASTIKDFVLVVATGSNKKWVIHHAIEFTMPAGVSVYLPYATRDGDLSLNILLSANLSEEDAEGLRLEDYADNPPIFFKKLIDRKPVLKSNVEHILNGIDKIVNRVKRNGVYLIKKF